MRQFLLVIFDYIFPPSPEERLVRTTSPHEMQSLYQLGRHEDIWYLASFAEPVVKAAVHRNKYHADSRAARLLAVLVTQWAAEQKAGIVCVAVPLSGQREQARGHNQVTTVLTEARRAGAPITLTTHALRRTRHTPPQTHLARAERLKNMTDAFVVRDVESIAGKHVVLFDDVVTTGATLRAAKAALLPHVASVTCVALAH